jgi:hypothetical protein
MAFEIGQNARRPLFVVVLKDDYGEVSESVVDLTTAGHTSGTAFFNLRAVDGATKISRGTATITNAAGGEVTYAWGTADTDTAGDFYGQVEIIWNDGKPETFPSGPAGTDDGTGYWPVEIHPELD